MRASACVTNFGDSVCMLSITPLISSAVHLYAVHFDHAVTEFFYLGGVGVAVAVMRGGFVLPTLGVKPWAWVFDVARLGVLDFRCVAFYACHNYADHSFIGVEF